MPPLAEPVSIVVALLTPFSEREGIDLAALREHVEFLVGEGVDGLMPCGTTGEGPLLEDDEALAVIAAVVEAARGRLPVFAHIGRPSTAATTRLAQRAIETGAEAVSAVVPYYYALEQAQLVSHYRGVLHAAGETPVFAYNIPTRTGNDLGAETARALAAEGLAGIKDSTKSFERHLEYLAVARSRGGFAVLMGSDGFVLRALQAGAAGSVSALANVRPDLLVRLKRAFLEQRWEVAEALQEEIGQLRARLSAGPALSGLKRAAAQNLAAHGMSYPSHLRAPLG